MHDRCNESRNFESYYEANQVDNKKNDFDSLYAQFQTEEDEKVYLFFWRVNLLESPQKVIFNDTFGDNIGGNRKLWLTVAYSKEHKKHEFLL